MNLHISCCFDKVAFRLLLLIVSVLFLSGCAALRDFQAHRREASTLKLAAGKRKEYQQAHLAFRSQPGWRKKTYRQQELLDKATVKTASVEISLREQRGVLFVNGAVAMDFPVATGRSSHPTPKGIYKIIDKKREYSSNLYGRIVSETGETLVSDADTRRDLVPPGASFKGSPMPLWMRITPTGVGMHVGNVPGRPASHGCIRLKKEAATELFRVLPLGTPVTVDFFAPTLGGPMGVGSIVTSEGAHHPPPPRSKPKVEPPPPLPEGGGTTSAGE